jgi:hypothetical protein
MAVLALGGPAAAEQAWSAALAHAVGCPACQDRLLHLAEAALSPSADEIPCAECQARMPAYLAMRAAGEEVAQAFPRLAAHLADCSRCQAVADLLAPVALADGWDQLPEPARSPRFDTTFLTPRSSVSQGSLAERLGGWWRRVTAPPAVRRTESATSFGVLGMAALVVLLLVGAAATWALFRPDMLPLPIAPRARTATPGPSPTATSTATVTATLTPRPGGRPAVATGSAPGTGARGAPLAGTPVSGPAAASPAAVEEPRERLRRPTLPPVGTTPDPPPTTEPYPGPSDPTEGPTPNPYPGPEVTPEPSASPGV